MNSYFIGILGYLVIAIFVLQQSKSQKTQSLSNGTADFSFVTRNDNDDFIPYQGERFSIFDWALFKTASKKYSGNLLISPISLKFALLLLYEGAVDESAYQIAVAMQLPATRSATRDRFSSILRSVQAYSPDYTLNTGSRIYIDSNITFREQYGVIVKSFYDTDVISADFSNAQPLVQSMNAWISNVTNGNIDRLIEDENSVKNSLMLILNGLYFKGAWQRKYFKPENTRIGKFHTKDNKTVDVPFMHTVGRFYYSESRELDAKILRLPYAGHKFAMYLVLPYTLNGIDTLTNEINPFLLTRHIWLMQDVPVDLRIPKFKFESSTHMEPILRELGIRDIFDDTATLTGISKFRRESKKLKVSDVLQKTGIEMNENGTTAYVATEIDIGNKIEDETFHVDRPFVFYIEEETTGTVIYTGRIMNPLDTLSSTNDETKEHSSSSIDSTIPDSDSILQTGLNIEDRSNLFNTHFSQTLNKQYQNENLVLSPASVKMALTMLMEGANGNSKSELISVLRLPEEESRRTELIQNTLRSLKRNENGTEIDFSARLWVHENLPVLHTYEDTVRLRYKSDVQNVNFKDSKNTAALINKWIRNATRNALSSLIDVQPDTRILLTSVVYFKGHWLKSFDKAKTKLECFYIPNGECRKTYMMKHESVYRYAYVHSIDAHVLEIPYSDGKTSMLVLMPKRRENDPYLRILSEDLVTVPVSAILASLKRRDVTVHLPKFKIESNFNLEPTLKRMGIENIFGSNANFTALISNGLVHVTDVLQNVEIEVDEEGTLAAADTEVGYELLSAWGNDIKMDRPFIFIIVDSLTNTILFSGRFIKPR
ncbi:uncharacterized protein LOC108630369 [Ceratina calcarata]|uniref:Uncharacterized protein LOC108630369 n=1 Tax=Ceratina calcarata TaxID=156304 RepID=A0AAJ7NDJ3_9HYME|nr:uncharacterized protein LOC108630369 [Ceratina calcarata]